MCALYCDRHCAALHCEILHGIKLKHFGEQMHDREFCKKLN